MPKRKNAGLFSKRKTKKARGQGTDSYIRLLSSRSRHTKATRAAKRSKNPAVYDASGKLVGKFSRKAAKIVARVVGGTIGKPARNPRKSVALLFRSKKAAENYARAHRGKRMRVTIQKVSKAR